MTLSLEEQMRIAAGYSEQEGGEEPKKHEVVQPHQYNKLQLLQNM